MANKWRQQAKQLVGQQIVVRDTKGQVHHGVLQEIQKDGIQIRPMGGGAGMATAKPQSVDVEQAIATHSDEVGSEEVFFLPAFLIAWALIAGLWGAAAYGAYAPYGPYGYGYGYGVGPYRRAVRRGVYRRAVRPPYRPYW